MVLVTDAIAGAGLPEGEHRFGSQTMEIKGNRAVIKGTQTLCGRYSLYSGLILISMIKLWDTVFIIFFCFSTCLFFHGFLFFV